MNRLRANVFLLSLAALGTAVVAIPAFANDLELNVFAAASLTEAFNEIARRFSAKHPGTKVVFNFAGSQQLSAQIVEGAPADVFASANYEQMTKVVDAGLLSGAPKPFVTNQLAIAVELGNPKKVTSLADLARSGLTVVLATEEVPAGRYANEALRKAGVTVTPASLELDVRSVLSKVSLGEADAGIVYRSDIVAAGAKVQTVGISAEHNVTATYPIAVLANASQPATAAEFVEFVLSDTGQYVFSRFGFTAPAPPAPAAK